MGQEKQKQATKLTSLDGLCSFVLAALSVIYLWHTLPGQAGVAEVWDDPTAYSLLWLHGTGVALGVMFPRRVKEISWGAFVGQVIWYCSIGPGRPFFLLIDGLEDWRSVSVLDLLNRRFLHLLGMPVIAWICLLMAAHTLFCTLGAIVGAAVRLIARGRPGLEVINHFFLRMLAWRK
jgi:hypothetical protein